MRDYTRFLKYIYTYMYVCVYIYGRTGEIYVPMANPYFTPIGELWGIKATPSIKSEKGEEEKKEKGKKEDKRKEKIWTNLAKQWRPAKVPIFELKKANKQRIGEKIKRRIEEGVKKEEESRWKISEIDFYIVGLFR